MSYGSVLWQWFGLGHGKWGLLSHQLNEPATHVVSHVDWCTSKDNTEFSMVKHFPGIGISLGDGVVCVVGKDMFSPWVKDDDLCVVCVLVVIICFIVWSVRCSRMCLFTWVNSPSLVLPEPWGTHVLWTTCVCHALMFLLGTKCSLGFRKRMPSLVMSFPGTEVATSLALSGTRREGGVFFSTLIDGGSFLHRETWSVSGMVWLYLRGERADVVGLYVMWLTPQHLARNLTTSSFASSTFGF